MINIINSESSFNDIDSWIKDLRSFSSPDVKVFLIGNKADLEESRVVSKEQALQVQKDFDLDLFMETSAKTGFTAQNLFIEASKILYGEFLKYKNNTIKKVGKKFGACSLISYLCKNFEGDGKTKISKNGRCI